MNRRILIVGVIMVAAAGLTFLLVRAWDVEFLAFVVERTAVEKLDSHSDPEAVRAEFRHVRQELDQGRIRRVDYRVALLEAAAFMEKVEVLQPRDVERIFGYFHPGR